MQGCLDPATVLETIPTTHLWSYGFSTSARIYTCKRFLSLSLSLEIINDHDMLTQRRTYLSTVTPNSSLNLVSRKPWRHFSSKMPNIGIRDWTTFYSAKRKDIARTKWWLLILSKSNFLIRHPLGKSSLELGRKAWISVRHVRWCGLFVKLDSHHFYRTALASFPIIMRMRICNKLELNRIFKVLNITTVRLLVPTFGTFERFLSGVLVVLV